MVKLTGPLQSTAASGTLGGLLTFGTNRRTHTLRRKPQPVQPNSGLQLSMRAMMLFLTHAWRSLPAYNQSTWENAYPGDPISNYNSYLKYNLKRWRNFQTPTQAWPAAEITTPTDMISYTAFGHTRHAILESVIIFTPNNHWGTLQYHATTNYPTLTLENVVFVNYQNSNNIFLTKHAPLEPGTHYYCQTSFSPDGIHRTSPSQQDTAIVT